MYVVRAAFLFFNTKFIKVRNSAQWGECDVPSSCNYQYEKSGHILKRFCLSFFFFFISIPFSFSSENISLLFCALRFYE